MKGILALTLVTILLFTNACDNSNDNEEKAYPFSETFKIYCEKEKECNPEKWAETYADPEEGLAYCIKSGENEMNQEIYEDGDMVDTEECRKAIFEYYKCLSVLTCTKYTETLECDDSTAEEDYCLCHLEENSISATCPAEIPDDI